MKPIIEIQNLTKSYKLGESFNAYSTIRDVFSGMLRNKKHISEENINAINDISFDVMPGESIGIIGRNGAGKSTLLKVLSRITSPTSGKVILRGRVASLLEVGTGFHSELTGRENIFFNGSILGLRKHEIISKFDEIVEFSGVEKFIDTPLKHYSSGMQLRLAFAVAAHLEPEILIVDEVLAVGDAEFQKKSIGKMNEVALSGRTLLFVSHNLGAIAQLCKRCVLLDKGNLIFLGETNQTLITYSEIIREQEDGLLYKGDGEAVNKIISALYSDDDKNFKNNFLFNQQILLHISLKHSCIDNLHLGISVLDKFKNKIFTDYFRLQNNVDKDLQKVLVRLPYSLLAPGNYSLNLALFVPGNTCFDWHEDCSNFEIIDSGTEMSIFEGQVYGSIITKCGWEYE